MHRYAAMGDLVTTVAYSYQLGILTVQNIIKTVFIIIWYNLRQQAMTVHQEEEWLNISKHFYNKWNLPYCVGTLDGQYVLLQAMTNSGSLF